MRFIKVGISKRDSITFQGTRMEHSKELFPYHRLRQTMFSVVEDFMRTMATDFSDEGAPFTFETTCKPQDFIRLWFETWSSTKCWSLVEGFSPIVAPIGTTLRILIGTIMNYIVWSDSECDISVLVSAPRSPCMTGIASSACSSWTLMPLSFMSMGLVGRHLFRAHFVLDLTSRVRSWDCALDDVLSWTCEISTRALVCWLLVTICRPHELAATGNGACVLPILKICAACSCHAHTLVCLRR